MRGETSDVAIEFLANSFLDLEDGAVEETDIIGITGTSGTCKHGKLKLFIITMNEPPLLKIKIFACKIST